MNARASAAVAAAPPRAGRALWGPCADGCDGCDEEAGACACASGAASRQATNEAKALVRMARES
jgi:hypothetical protein